MDERDWLVERFEEHRPHLRAVAYRMLGSLAEADEAVQDAWLRVSRAGADGVENFRGWLTTIVARVCLNALQARKARPEDSAGVHLPDPIVKPAGEVDPEYEVLMADSVGLALQVVSTRCPQPSDWFSCCTTCSTCRSMRSDPWWGALQPQRGSSPAVPGDACTEHPRRSLPRLCSPATGRRCVLRRRAQRRLRRARRGVGSQRRAPIGWRRKAPGPFVRSPWSERSGADGAAICAAARCSASCHRQWRPRRSRRDQQAALLRDGVRCCPWQDRRD
jgi:hypothetical protein